MTRDSKKSAGGKNASNDAPKWSDTQQRRVQEAFQRNRTKIKRQTNVNIEISIGRRAPRTWAYYAVPTFVVEIAPRYRGYRYAWVDDRYVIVHPKTFEIVAYIDAGSGRIYANSMRDACTTVSLSPNERERIVAAIDVRDRHDIEGVRVGFDLPDRITLQTFPSEVRRDFDGFANCRFVALSNDRIAVVAPSSREIVAILQR